MRKSWIVLALLLCTRAAPARGDDYVDDLGYGLLAAVSNLGYIPVKLTYAAIGAAVGGVAYLVTGADLDAAGAVWAPALGGTYVLTSSMLRGDTPIEFAAVNMPDSLERRDETVSDEPLT